ncbi:MAG: [FeFe] hydrogenase H-cluster maturation GTPase HydF [Acidaminococcaceae bacterium]
MSLNTTPASERLHIGIFGKRNAGKSSVINALTNQNIAIVSPIKGTTTDPVLKAMELLPLGPVMIIDTPGLDDEGELGTLRMQKAYQMLNKTDIALLVIDSELGLTQADEQLLEQIKAKAIPFLLVFNKIDLASQPQIPSQYQSIALGISTKTGANIEQLKNLLAQQLPAATQEKKLVGDLLKPGDFVILVVPLDESAPKGRLILPQQQTIRDILEAGATSIVVRETELAATLAQLGTSPQLVITDSQVFAQVAKITPPHVLLTSFSILFARYKGDLVAAVNGAKALNQLVDGDTVLIAEGCTHHRQCNDIGSVKLPGWISKYTGRQLKFAFTSGIEFPTELDSYQLIVHCGGCMLNAREMQYRMQTAHLQQIPITNYGIVIAYMQGILRRTLAPFPELQQLLD